MFCDFFILTWEHVNNIPSRPLTSTIISRPLTSIIKGPENAVTLNFTNSIESDMSFRHLFSHIVAIINY